MKFGIIGTGLIAEFHARALSEIKGAELEACMDVNSERAAGFGAKYHCTSYNSIEHFLKHPSLEIVTVCTPSGLHRDMAVAAAHAGKHVIVEKPLEISTERCQQIIDACKKNNVVLSGIFPSRFFSAASTVKKAVDAGRFGKLTMGTASVKWWREQSYYSTGGWKGTRSLDGGGALINQSIHAIDLLLWYMGDAEEVYACMDTSAHSGIEVEDNAVVAVRFKNGAIGTIHGSTSVWPGFLKRLEISGTAGSAILEEENLTFWKFKEENPDDEYVRKQFAGATHTGGGASDPAAISHHGHKLQFLDIIDAIQNNREPLIDGEEAMKAVRLIEAAYRSAELDKPVSLGEM